MTHARRGVQWRRSPAPIVFLGLLLLFVLLVFALSRNEPPPAADDAQAGFALAA